MLERRRVILITAICRTFSSLSDKDRILQKLEDVAAELESDMKEGGWTGKTVTLKYKLDTYQGQSSYATPGR